MEEKISKEDMVKEAVEEAKAKAAINAEKNKDEEALQDEEVPKAEDSAASEDMSEGGEEAECAGEPDKASEEAECADEPDKASEKGTKRFGRKLRKDKKDEKIEELTDRILRSMAEFDNFRKRTEKEKAVMYDIGARGIIEKILPVVDNLERGLKAIPQEGTDDPFASGMEKIYKQLITTLQDLGVKPIEAVGNKFDPNFHNAVMHEENKDYDENVVTEEFQKGYTYHDIVVRHSMVKVAN